MKDKKIDGKPEEGEELCLKCGSRLIIEDGEKICPDCDAKIDYFGDDGDKK